MSTSNSDLNGIREFLQDFPSYSYDAESWSPYTNSAAVPRQTLVYDTQSMAGTDPYDDGSVQTAEYAASTATYTTGQQSLFDRPHTGAASSVGQSSAPSRGTGRVTFPQQFALDPAPVYQGYPAPDYHLWCEFRVLKNCNVFFRGDDEAGWIQHHARHLKDRFPSQVVCWFCDHIPFVAQNTADRRANFEWRMQHIREHINSD